MSCPEPPLPERERFAVLVDPDDLEDVREYWVAYDGGRQEEWNGE